MDWVLPDTSRHVSGHHFDVRYHDGAYWLTDASTNGTFMQGQHHRIQGPLQLRGGERLIVGHYIISVDAGMPAAQAAPRPPVSQGSGYQDDADPWDLGMQPQDPVNPIPQAPANARAFDDVAQEFLQLSPQMPSPSRTPAAAPEAAPPPPAPEAPAGQPPIAPVPMPSPASPTPAPAPQPAASPPPMPTSASAPAMQQQPQAPDRTADILRAFCEGAGLDPNLARTSDPEKLAHALGQATSSAATEVMRMLQDRASVKQFTKGGERTMRNAHGNNPMKFLPDAPQAMETMFLAPREGFMEGPESFATALADLRSHQQAVFAALQPALAAVLDGLSPEEIRIVRGRPRAADWWATWETLGELRCALGQKGFRNSTWHAGRLPEGVCTGLRGCGRPTWEI